MQIDIKCLDCGKMTRHFELGQLFYDVNNPSSNVVVKEPITCPKCRVDISDKKCMAKTNYFLMSLVAANITRTMEEEGSFTVPDHLRGAIPLRKQQYDVIAPRCRTRLQFVEKF